MRLLRWLRLNLRKWAYQRAKDRFLREHLTRAEYEMRHPRRHPEETQAAKSKRPG